MKLLTVQQVADRLHVSVRTVSLWLTQGRFPGAYKLPGKTNPWLIPEKAVVVFTRPVMGRPHKQR